MPISPGTTLGRYEIRSLLGVGGMGEVYLAEDTQLGRTVALKILKSELAIHQKGLQRFMQEARAASSLSHPNILTIYEIGEVESTCFIAMEYVGGVTLREHMRSTRMKIDEALDIASQIASALIAAHAASIVHRDIKPENIMIRPDGYIKVLDFGLCKLVETTSSDPTAETISETNPNVLMGTPMFMSPEQAQGIKVDARSDIWSLGCVLYEMLTGWPPFEGASTGEVMASIFNDEPQPLARYNRDAPEELEWIIEKALRKDREERYQSAKELFADLRSLKHRLEFEAAVKRSGSSLQGVTGDESETVEIRHRSLSRALRERPAHVSSKRERLRRDIKRSPNAFALALATIAVLIAASIYGIYKLVNRNEATHRAVSFQTMKVSKLTATGKATRAAISPDGQFVVHVMADAGRQSLWVRQVATTSNVQIVPPDEVVYRGLTFTPDRNYVYYVVQEKNNPIQVLYQVPVLGGTPTRVLSDIDTPVTFSPDGSQMAFIRRYRVEGEDALIIADAQGRNERKLASRRGDDFFGVVSAGGPSWSPDGQTIACPAGSNTGGRSMNVVAIGIEDGSERQITAQKWFDVGRVAWLPDASGLVLSATEQGSTSSQIWQVSYPNGEVRKVTNDLNDYRDMSLTGDAQTLVTVQNEARVNVWTVPGGDVNRARQITTGIGQYDGARGISWMPDGRIVYVSRLSGSQDIWLMDADGTRQQQLTTASTRADVYPSASSDGRYIVFSSNRTGNSNIWRMNPDGSNPVQLTNGKGEEFPSCSPDGKWVVYTSTATSKFTIWRVPIDGGEPQQITDQLSQWPVVSPDSNLISCWYRSEPNSPWRIAIIPFDGGEPVKMLDVPTTVTQAIPFRWTVDGRAISYIDTRDGVSNIWSQPISGGRAVQLTDFKSDQMFWFDWSTDGRLLAIARGSVTNDVVTISDFHQAP